MCASNQHILIQITISFLDREKTTCDCLCVLLSYSVSVYPFLSFNLHHLGCICVVLLLLCSKCQVRDWGGGDSCHLSFFPRLESSASRTKQMARTPSALLQITRHNSRNKLFLRNIGTATVYLFFHLKSALNVYSLPWQNVWEVCCNRS